MRPFEQVAVDFAAALAAGEFERARSLLSPALRARYSAEELHRHLFGMLEGYADGFPTSIRFDDDISLAQWPARQPGDVGWAYVGILGEGFVEGVSVTVADMNGGNFIREIEWGRP